MYKSDILRHLDKIEDAKEAYFISKHLEEIEEGNSGKDEFIDNLGFLEADKYYNIGQVFLRIVIMLMPYHLWN
jgi:hypothetical protein